MLPDLIGDFRAKGGAKPYRSPFETVAPEDFGAISAAVRTYTPTDGRKLPVDGREFIVRLVKTRADSGAYALLTSMVKREREFAQSFSLPPPSTLVIKTGEVGTASAISPPTGAIGCVRFFKGTTFVEISSTGKETGDIPTMTELARSLAETLDAGEGEIPVLVQHLPQWETAQGNALYAVSLHALQEFIGSKPALYAVDFSGGAEAVTAAYGPSRLVIIENTTPQLATNNDVRINERLKELRERGEPLPTAYRRVGNYSVFVFDAPDEKAAAQLIDAVDYEQVVRWLGENPHWLERMQRNYTNTMGGVILSVIKGSGLALLLCLAIGSIFGSLIFLRRRAQQAATNAFSDAGGIVRLNIDDMTPQSNPARLLGRGER